MVGKQLYIVCRHYRQSDIETPSHPGGVPREYKEKQENRHCRDREKGVHASSKDSSKDGERDRHKDRRKDRDKYRNRGIVVLHELNPSQNNKILDRSSFIGFADNMLVLAQMFTFVFNGIENLVAKGENADYQHFLNLPQCFHKSSFSAWLKLVQTQDYVVKGKNLYHMLFELNNSNKDGF